MVKFRSNNPDQQPSARPSVAGVRVARQAPDPVQEPLEPADTFDLGDEAASAEAAAGEWLGRKAAAKSRRKSAQGKSSYKMAAAKPNATGSSSARSASDSGRGAVQDDSARAQADGEQAPSSARPSRKGTVAKAKPKANRKKVLAVVGIALAAVLVACGAVAGFWAWDKWLRYDDAADIQGEWATEDGSAIVVIDSEAIHMPDSVNFAYTMDTKEKTISYSFDQLQGGGSYVFSDDRSVLTITEADGSLTVFVKRSSDTSGEPRVVSASGGAASAVAQPEASSSDAANGTNADAPAGADAASTNDADLSEAASNELDEQEAAEVADALSSTSEEDTPGANAVQPGSATAGA